MGIKWRHRPNRRDRAQSPATIENSKTWFDQCYPVFISARICLCRLQRFRRYNLLTLRKPAGIVLSLLFLALSELEAPLQAQQQSGPARVSRLLLIIPFENTSN